MPPPTYTPSQTHTHPTHPHAALPSIFPVNPHALGPTSFGSAARLWYRCVDMDVAAGKVTVNNLKVRFKDPLRRPCCCCNDFSMMCGWCMHMACTAHPKINCPLALATRALLKIANRLHLTRFTTGSKRRLGRLCPRAPYRTGARPSPLQGCFCASVGNLRWRTRCLAHRVPYLSLSLTLSLSLSPHRRRPSPLRCHLAVRSSRTSTTRRRVR